MHFRSTIRHQLSSVSNIPQEQPQRSPSEEQLNAADNLRTSLPTQTYQDRQQRTRSAHRVDPFSDVSSRQPVRSTLLRNPTRRFLSTALVRARGALSLDFLWTVLTERS